MILIKIGIFEHVNNNEGYYTTNINNYNWYLYYCINNNRWEIDYQDPSITKCK